MAAGLQKIENSTKKLFFGDFLLFFLESMILSHHLVAIFKKIHLHARPVMPFELGVTLVLPYQKKGVEMFLFHFGSQSIIFRLHIMQIGMKFPFQKCITLHSLI